MWSLGPHCHTLLRGYRFRDPQWEADFQARSQQWAINPVRVYILVTLALTVISLLDYSRYFDKQPGFFVHLLVGAAASLVFAGTFRSRAVRRRIVPLFAWGCLAMVMAYCYVLTENIQVWGDYAINHFVWRLGSLPEDDPLRQQAELFIRREVTTEAMSSTLLCTFNHWMVLALLGFNWHILAAFVGIYVSLTTTLVIDSHNHIDASTSSIFIVTLANLAFPTCGILFERLRRTNFLNEVLLTREMQASRMADSMLNHTLKNLLADVAATIEVFLAGQAPGSALEDSVTCLRRGMMACKERQVYLKLVSGEYVPVTQMVNLRGFGKELCAGRKVQLEAVDLSVYLDSTICHLILENALSNAFCHGHPQHPDVKLVIASVNEEGATPTDCQRIQFTVENVADPERPPLSAQDVQRLLRGQAHLLPNAQRPTLSDGIGIAHCVMAAQLGGLSLSLAQEGPVVRFSATLDALPVGPSSAPSGGGARGNAYAWCASSAAEQFPPALRFCCIDDSPAALRLLDLHIRRWCAPSAVHLFGHSEEDVHRFVPFALEHADVVIVDQYLGFSQTYLGTDLVRQLCQSGFAGLVCVRSADDGAEDHAEFHRAGAHCCFGKDVLGWQLMEDLKAAYVQLCGRVNFSLSGSWETRQLMRTESVSTISPTHCPLGSRGWQCTNAPRADPGS
eukprot:EG_transcript_4111